MKENLDKNISQNLEYIPLSEAGKILNTSRDYMNVLVRRGKLRAIKLGRNWVTTKEWIVEYQKSVGKLFGFQVSEEVSRFRDLDISEKAEIENLKTKLVLDKELTERLEKFENDLQDLKISKFRDSKIKTFLTEREKQLKNNFLISRRLAIKEEKENILDKVKNQFKFNDFLAFEKTAKQFGILKSLRQRFNWRISIASGLVIILLAAAIGFTNLDISKFKDLNISTFQHFNISRFKNLEASIFSDVFKNFPSDIPDFSDWLTLSFSRGLSLFKPQTLSELVIGPLKSGPSKIVKPQEALPTINTLAQAEALDIPSEFLAEESETQLLGLATSTPGLITIENRLTALENVLVDQMALVKADLSIQKKTLLETIDSLMSLAKLVPIHPISTIVVQGSPATLTTYSVAPQVQTGFDRLSATSLNLASDAVINGHLTVKSGGEFNTLSVSGSFNAGASTLSSLTVSGNTTISGTLSVTGDTTLANLTLTGTLNAATSTVSFGNASTTYLTVSNTGWIKNGTITNASTTYATLPTFWGTTGNVTNLTITNASTTYATLPTFWGTNGTITNASTTYLTVSSGLFFPSGFINSSGNVGIATTTIPSGFGFNVATSTFVYGNQFISGGLGVGLATTTTGAIQTTGDVFVGRNLYVSGNSTVLGGSLTDTLTVNSSVNSNFVPNQNNVYNLGSPAFYWSNLYVDTINANNISGASTTISGTKSADFTINTDNASVDQEDANLIFYRGTVPPNAVITWNAATSSKRFEFNQAARFFNQSASTTNPVLTVQGNTGLTANLFQVLDVSTSTTIFSVNPVSQKTTMINASTTNLTISGSLFGGTGGLSFGSAILLPDGSVSAPSLSFTSDTDTGIFRIGENKIGFSTGATTSLALDSGKVIVGNAISTASYQLEVNNRDAFNNTVVDELRLAHYTTGTANNGLGTGLLFYGQDAEGAGQNLARIAAVVEQATSSATFKSGLTFSTVGSGGLLEKMRITGNGQLLLATTTIPSDYGANIATSTNIYGNLRLPATTAAMGIIKSGANTLLHTFGTDSFFVGISAGNLTLTSSEGKNTGVGNNALTSVTTANRLTAVGYNALTANTSGSNNTALGDRALATNITGASNTAVGSVALTGNTGSSNTAVGFETLQSNTSGGDNTAVGFDSLANNITGSQNTAIGIYSLLNTTAGNNVAVGRNAGRANTSGSTNTFIGAQHDDNFGLTSANLTNATAIGYNAVVTQSNTLILGNGANVGIGTTTPNNLLTITGTTTPALGFTANSSTGANGLSAWTMGIDTADANKFKIASSTAVGTNTRLTIDGNGNVGIGTAGPASSLEIYKNSAGSVETLRLSTVDASVGLDSGPYINFNLDNLAGGKQLAYIKSGITLGGSGDKAYLSFWTRNSEAVGERVRIADSGNVGIGTTTPTSGRLVVQGSGTDSTAAGLNVTDSSGISKLYVRNDGAVGIGTTAFPASTMLFQVGSNLTSSVGSTGDRVHISAANAPIGSQGNSQGNLAVMTTDSFAIDIGGSIGLGGKYNTTGNTLPFGNIAGRKENSTDGNGNGYLQFATMISGGVPTERMRITSAGNVGIASTSPSAVLSVNVSNATGNTAALNINSATTSLLFVRSDGSIGMGITNPASDVRLQIKGVANSTNLRYFDNGRLLVGGVQNQAQIYVEGANNWIQMVPEAFADGFVDAGSNQFAPAVQGDTVIARTGAGSFLIGSNSGGTLKFVTDATVRTIITSAGNVGIGTTSPWGKLSVQSDNTSIPQFIIASSTAMSLIVNNLGSVGIGIDPSTIHTSYKFMVHKATNNNLGFTDDSEIGTGPALVAINDANGGLPFQIRASKIFLTDTGTGDEFLRFDTLGTAQFGSNAAAPSAQTIKAPDATGAGPTNGGSLTVRGGSPAGTGGYGNLLFQSNGGNIGIGTTTPNNLLALTATTTPAIGFSVRSNTLESGFWTMGIDTADANKFKIASSTAVGTNARLTIDGNGNVGIGTAIPLALLDVNGVSAASVGAVGAPGFAFRTDLNTGMYSTAEDTLLFATGGTERIRVTSSGGVGIGGLVPSSGVFVHISESLGSAISNTLRLSNINNATSSGTGIEFTHRTTYNYKWRIASQATDGDPNPLNPAMVFSVDNGAGSYTEKMRIDVNGKLGIGSTTPSAILSINNANYSVSPSTPLLNISSTTQSFLYVNNVGSVGIGTTDVETFKLLVLGARDPNLANALAAIESSDAFGADIGGGLGLGGMYTATAKSMFAILRGNKENADNADLAGYFSIDTRPNNGSFTERLRVTSAGKIGIATTTIPSGYGMNIATSTYIFGKLTVGTSSIDILSGNIISNSGQFNITNAANTALTFSTNNLERMRIDNSGNVGIGTTTPGNSALLAVAGKIYSGTGGFIFPDGTTQTTAGGNPMGYISGLTLSNDGTDATNDIDIAAGTARNDDNTADITLASTLVKQLDAAWAVGTNQGGLDTGTIANTTYHVWLIKRSDTGVVDVLFSTSATSPTMPTNYDKKRRIGSILRESAAIVLFVQDGNRFDRKATGSTSATNPGTAAVTTTLLSPVGISLQVIVRAIIHADSTAAAEGIISALDVNDEAPDSNNHNFGAGRNDTQTVDDGTEIIVRTNTSAQVRMRINSSNGNTVTYALVVGWLDARGGAGVFSGVGATSAGTVGQIPYFSANGNSLTATSTIFLSTAGNVGIGTTTPTQALTISKAAAAANANIPNGWLCVDDDGGCVGTTAGTIYAKGGTVTGSTDVAENYMSAIQLEAGDIVMATGGKNIDKATSTSATVIGAVSTAPGVLLGYDMDNRANDSSTYPVALAGRVPVKVSLENGPIAIGDRISVSSIAGIGKKASSTEATVGIALEPFDGWSVDPNGAQTFSQTGKTLVFVNLGQPQLAAAKGTGDLASMVTASSDLNMDGFSILNVKSITGINGLWKIDENGNIIAQSVETQKLTVGGGIASGVTIYDRTSGSPTCIYIEGGVIKTSGGACGATTNAGVVADLTQTGTQNNAETLATTTPAIEPTPIVATSTEPILISTTTLEIAPAQPSPEATAGTASESVIATTTESVITSTTTPETATTTP